MACEESSSLFKMTVYCMRLPRYARNDNVKTFMAFVLMSATYKNEN
jgi:hypothetical protein